MLQKGLAFIADWSVTDSTERDDDAGISPRCRGASGSAAPEAACSCVGDTGDNRSSEWRRRAKSYHQVQPERPAPFHRRLGRPHHHGDDQENLVRLWREKRGETEPQDLSDNLIVQLGTVTEVLNRAWYQRASGQTVKDIQKRVRHPVHKWMAATLDGTVEQTGAVFEAKFMLPWAFTEEAAAEKHMAQLQHNMWVTASRTAVLSIITGGGKWVEIKLHADPLYQHLLLTAEKKFWRCVQSGEPPILFNIETPRPRLEAVKVVDMSTSNQWVELAASYLRTREAHGEHETAKADLKKLIPEDAKEAAGHGIKAKRSKAGAISFEAQLVESSHAPVQ